MQQYLFDQQLHKGHQGEEMLYAYLAKDWLITKAKIEDQRKGIDCFLCNKVNRKTYAVEIKSDSTAAKTDNAFIETVSVDTRDKQGWVFTSQADYILYFIPPLRLFYVLTPRWLRKKIMTWQEKYPIKKIKNSDYYTHGVLVPLTEFEGKKKVSIAVSF